MVETKIYSLRAKLRGNTVEVTVIDSRNGDIAQLVWQFKEDTVVSEKHSKGSKTKESEVKDAESKISDTKDASDSKVE